MGTVTTEREPVVGDTDKTLWVSAILCPAHQGVKPKDFLAHVIEPCGVVSVAAGRQKGSTFEEVYFIPG
jgi:hypothetical protein